MEIIIERFDRARMDTGTVARLLYSVDPSLTRFVLGEEDTGVPIIMRLLGMEHNDYAARRILCARAGDRVVGVLAGVTGSERRVSRRAAAAEWCRALGARGTLRALMWGPKLARVITPQVRDDEYYLAALVVDESRRGQGIGSKLLDEVLQDHRTVVAEVNITKADAIRFYERHGFTLGERMTFTHDGVELGNYQIRRVR